MKIVTVRQMENIEASANADGLSYERMMHNAGQGVAEWVAEKLDMRRGVLGLVGSGNNGGDTLIALTQLTKQGVRTVAFLAKDRGDDPLLSDFVQQGGQVVDISHNENFDVFKAALQPRTVLLDGILGTGLRLPLRGELKKVMARVQEVVKSRPGALVVSVDCPSGMDCDTGEVSGETLRAAHTLCMAAIKQGLLKHPGREFAGQLHWIGIGIADISKYISSNLSALIGEDLVRDYLPDRPADGHKGTFGTCQVIAGTRPFIGAAFLSGKAAYRAGCGLVDIATLSFVQKSLAGSLVEAVWTILPEQKGGFAPEAAEILLKDIQNKDSLVIGPGFGLAKPTESFVHQLVQAIPDDYPVLIDADGLKLLSLLSRWWEHLPENTILTPHPGEMAVLTGLTVDEVQADRWEIASRYAQKWKATIILKGAGTVIATKGGRLYVNPISDPSLATAGSGDVLAGIIGGLLAQGCSHEEASVAGVWLHAQAGLEAKESLGTEISVTAVDILNYIPTVLHSLEKIY